VLTTTTGRAPSLYGFLKSAMTLQSRSMRLPGQLLASTRFKRWTGAFCAAAMVLGLSGRARGNAEARLGLDQACQMHGSEIQSPLVITKAADAFTGDLRAPLIPGLAVDAATVGPVQSSLTPQFVRVASQEFNSVAHFVQGDVEGVKRWTKRYFTSQTDLPVSQRRDALLIAAHLKARWKYLPDARSTRLRPFHGLRMRPERMMMIEAPIGVLNLDNLSVAELSMTNNVLFDAFVLSDKPCSDFHKLASSIAGKTRVQHAFGTVELPRMSIRSSDISRQFPRSWIHTRNGRPLILKRLQIANAIALDERGVTADSSLVADVPMGRPHYVFIFNKPFGFVVRTATGQTMFEGVYY